MLLTEEHKHCIFCGNVVNNSNNECKSANNITEPDTTGKKYHATLS